MTKLFGLFLLALACWAPDLAQAASRFLICSTTCTLDASNTGIWSATSGGATGASVPGTSDDVALDANTCVGGTTCTATFGAGYNPTWITLTMSACTASTSGCILDANTNSNTITLTSASSGYVNNGSGTRTLSGGTWVLSGASAIWTVTASATITNSPSVSFTNTTGAATGRTFTGGGKTYGTLTVSSLSNGLPFVIVNANTIGTLTVTAPNKIILPQGSTNTITTFTNISGSSSNQTLFAASSLVFGAATISSVNNWTCDWCGFGLVAFTGGGTFSATNSFSFGSGNTGITISPPSGGGGGRIIGG